MRLTNRGEGWWEGVVSSAAVGGWSSLRGKILLLLCLKDGFGRKQCNLGDLLRGL